MSGKPVHGVWNGISQLQSKQLYCLSLLFFIGGYYTENLLNRPGYRVVVLNTNLYYDQNKVTENIDDPAGQFNWADQVLTEAANNKEKVLPRSLCCKK